MSQSLNKNSSERQRDQGGIAVIFSLLIVSLVTLIGLGVAAIIIRELRLSSNIGHAVSAYYAAESGVERGLYRVRVGKENDQEPATVVADIASYSSTTAFSSDAAYQNDATEFSGSAAHDLTENESEQIDYTIANPTDCGAGWTGACIDSWVVSWDAAESTATSLEVTFVGWRPGSPIAVLPNAQKHVIDESDLSGGQEILNFPDRQNMYRVRLRTIGENPGGTPAGLTDQLLKSVQIVAYSENDGNLGSGEIVNASTSITVQSIGEKQGFAQSVVATVPWQTTLSGIFEYVLFSEETLVKINPISVNPPIYRSGRLEIEQGVPSQCSCITAEQVGGIIACTGSGWQGACDPGAASNTLQVARCKQPGYVNMCSITSQNYSGSSNYAGFYVTPNIMAAPLSLAPSEYYVRINGRHEGVPSAIYLDEDVDNNPGNSTYKETFNIPTNGGTPCQFECLFTNPVKLGTLCTGGANSGEACTTAADCPGGACNNYQKIYFLAQSDTSVPYDSYKTYLDWYSLSSSPLLTGPDDKFCVDFTNADCN